MKEPTYTADEIMTVTAAHQLRNGAVCFVGIGLPSAACNLARLTHAPVSADDAGTQQRLFTNVAAALQGVPETIVHRQLMHFHGADPRYEEGVAKPWV